MKRVIMWSVVCLSVGLNVFFIYNNHPIQKPNPTFKSHTINPDAKAASFTPNKTAPRYLKNWRYNVQINMFKEYADHKMPVVMLGDSITYFGRWNELLNASGIANRGIPGDLTSGFLHRMQYVYDVHPKICFVMGGINDISQGVMPDTVYGRMVKITNELQSHHITPVIESALYIAKKRTNSTLINKRVHALNTKLVSYAQAHHIDYLNLNAEFQNGGYMQPQYTYDGVHPSGLGYHVWSKMILNELKKKHISPNK